MSTLLSQAQEKLQNTESSMKFMQAEHAQTLRGLHEEIHKLQTKCSDLTFKLHMLADGTQSPPDAERISDLKKEYKSRISDITQENHQLKSSLDENTATINLLQFQLQTTKTDLTESIRKKDVLIASLRNDLDSKSDQLAYLMSKIHNAKIVQMKVGSEEPASCTARYTPTPPPFRRGSPRPNSRHHSIDFSKTILSDPITSAAAEILSDQEKTVIVSKSVPLPAIGDHSASRSFLSKMKLNRRRDSKTMPPPSRAQ